MSAWSRSSDGKAASAEIKIESTRQGWDQLSKSSPKIELETGEAQTHQFIPHLARAYPKARKDTVAWLQFIKKITGKSRQWKSVSIAYKQDRNKTHNAPMNDAVRKRKSGKGLSDDALKAQDLVLTPQEEQHVKRQVNVLCVCRCVCMCCRFARPPKSAHLLTHPALTHDFLLVSLKKYNQSSGKAQKEARRKSKAGELLADEESHYVALYSHQTPCCSLARPPESAHLLTSPALTHDCLLVNVKKNNQAQKEAEKEARRKSKVGEDLTPQEEQHVKRQVNVLCVCRCVCMCCRFACPPKSAHLLTHPALTHDFLLVSLKKDNQSSGKAQKEARRKSN